jgi:uncharacterized protein (DUF169 family)
MESTHGSQAARLRELLGTRLEPIAISFRETAPEGVPRVERAAAASCSYWRMAAEGGRFYTVAEDHLNCPVGSYTHGVGPTPAGREDLQRIVTMMLDLSYLTPDDVRSLPKRETPLRVAVYAPLRDCPGAADIVLVRGTARQMMLLAEAAQQAGALGSGPTMGRPTCALLPQALATQRTAMSFGCVGNRVYTDAPDDEAYVAIPGARLEAVLAALAVVRRANQTLEAFHRRRKDELEAR